MSTYQSRSYHWQHNSDSAFSFILHPNGVELNAFDASRIDEPHFIHELKLAFAERQELFGYRGDRYDENISEDNKYYDYHRHNPPYSFDIKDSYYDGKGSWDLTDEQKNVDLTMVVYDSWAMRGLRATSKDYEKPVYVHYVDLCRHQRLMKELELKTRLDVGTLIKSEVSKGVSNGIKEAASKGQQTLEEIRKQKEQLSKELQRLETLEQKAITRELEAKQRAVAKEKPKEHNRKGYVYLLKAIHDPELFKIGRTNNPNRRIAKLGVNLPFAIECEHLIATEDMYALESELHQRFASQRLDGEFFRLSPTDVQYIKSLSNA